jgi:MICOS complex subunit MIC60
LKLFFLKVFKILNKRFYNKNLKPEILESEIPQVVKKSKKGQIFVVAGLALLGFSGSLYYTVSERKKKETEEQKEWVSNYEKELVKPSFEQEKSTEVVAQTVQQQKVEEKPTTIVVHSLEESEETARERKRLEEKESEENAKGTVYYEMVEKELSELKNRITFQLNQIETLSALKENLTKQNQEKIEKIEKLEKYQNDNEREIKILLNKVEELQNNLEEQIQKDILELNQKLKFQKEEMETESDKKFEELKSEYEIIIQNILNQMNERISNEIAKQKEIFDKKYFEKNMKRIQIFGDLTSRVYGMETILDNNIKYLNNSLQVQKLMCSVLSLEEISKTNAPFKPELELISKYSGNDEFIHVLISSIPDKYSSTGVKTIQDLEIQFDKLKSEALSLSYAPESTGLLGFIFSKIIGKIVIAEHGNVSGTSVDAKLSRAEFYLKHKNLAKAVEEVDSIGGLSGEFLESWLSAAKQRLVLQQTVSALNSHLLNTIQDIQ